MPIQIFPRRFMAAPQWHPPPPVFVSQRWRSNNPPWRLKGCAIAFLRCHFVAAFSTDSARFGTIFHVPNLIAARRARVANLGTDGTELPVIFGTDQHERC